MFLGCEDTIQLFLLLEIFLIRGEFTENEVISIAASVLTLIFFFLKIMMDVCKWLGGSKEKERELCSVQIRDDCEFDSESDK